MRKQPADYAAIGLVGKGHRKVDAIASIGPHPLKDTPWEKIARQIPDGASVEETLAAAGLDWEVLKLPVFTELEYEVSSEEHASGIARKVKRIAVPKSYTILRADNHQVISPFSGPRYKMIQNEQAFEAFEQFCLAGDLTMETAGMLSGGKHIWALASIGEGYELSPGEILKGYVLLFQSHYYGHSLKAMFTPVRYPGGLTLVKALNVKGKSGYYSMPHSRVFNDARRAEIEELVDMAEESLEKYARQAEFLSNAGFTQADGVYYLISVFDPKLVGRFEKRKEQLPLTYREALEHGDIPRPVKQAIGFMDDVPGADLPSMKGTAWGAYQTVAYGLDVAMGKGVDTRLESAWTGKNVKTKRRALNIASTMATTKVPLGVQGQQVVLETEES